MKKLFLPLLLVVFFATNAFAEKTYTISVTQIVEHPALDSIRNGAFDRLREKGLEINENVHIAQGNQATAVQIASQILGENPDLVFAIATLNAQTAALKIKSKPIIFSGVTDPISAGLVKDLANSDGKNITGMSDFSPMDKQMALIKEIVPTTESIGVIYNAGEPNSVVLVNKLKEEAQKAGMRVEEATIANSSGVYQAAKSLIGRCDVIYIPTDNTVVSALESVVKVCRQNHLPLFAADTDSVSRGAIAAIALDYYKMGLQTGDMMYEILVNGANPGDMPIEFLNDVSLHINVQSAKQMGVSLPKSVIERAAKVTN